MVRKWPLFVCSKFQAHFESITNNKDLTNFNEDGRSRRRHYVVFDLVGCDICGLEFVQFSNGINQISWSSGEDRLQIIEIRYTIVKDMKINYDNR